MQNAKCKIGERGSEERESGERSGELLERSSPEPLQELSKNMERSRGICGQDLDAPQDLTHRDAEMQNAKWGSGDEKHKTLAFPMRCHPQADAGDRDSGG